VIMKTLSPRLRVPAVMAGLGTAIAVGSLAGSGWSAALAVEAVTVVATIGYYAWGGRESDVGALVGSRPDERQVSVGLRASALAGIIMSYAAVFGFVIETARGRSAWPFALFCVIGAVTFMIGLVIYRVRG
jgi:hypothetical protein